MAKQKLVQAFVQGLAFVGLTNIFSKPCICNINFSFYATQPNFFNGIFMRSLIGEYSNLYGLFMFYKKTLKILTSVYFMFF
jgi:hypothetical protein